MTNLHIFAGIGLVAIIAAGLAHSAPNQNVVLWLGLMMFVGMAVAFFFRACRIARPMGKPFIKRILRTIRLMRRVHAISPSVKMLHSGAWSFGCLLVAATYSGHAELGHVCMIVFFALLVFAGLGDLFQRGAWFIRKLWSDMLGKVFSLTIGTILLYLSIAKAKTWIHSTTHIDPKYLTEATAIFAAVLLPIMYGFFAVVLLYLLALLQMLGMAFFMTAAMFAQQIGSFAGSSNVSRMKMLWYRLATGKKPLGNVLPKSSFFDDISVCSRPLSTIAIIFAFSIVSQTMTEMMPRLQPHMKTVLIAIEYRQGSSCRGFENGTPVVYMEDGNISVVRRDGNDWKFSVEACKFRDEANS